jgi:nucleoside-diphosphate-sugar epimerase
MRVLVTGGTGFIGSRVVRRLAEEPGVEALAVVRPGSNPWRLRAAGVPAGPEPVTVAAADLCDGPGLAELLRWWRPEVLVHLAAVVHHSHGCGGGPALRAVNLYATLRLHKTFLACGGRRFVFAGSSFEYGRQEAGLIAETAQCRPMYDYAVSKARATDALLARGAAAATETLVLRVFSPYGPHEAPWRIVPALLTAGLSGGPLDITAGGQVRDYLFVEDAARAFVTAALAPQLVKRQAIYNVSSGVGHSLRQLAAAVEWALSRPLRLAWGRLPYRPNEMMSLIGDNRRIAADLGWRPTVGLPAGLRVTAAGLRLAPCERACAA